MAGESESWTELLPESPIFERLKEAGALPEGEANVMCQIRGELFVWSHKERALLTTSLKKMTASPERYGDFQTLKCLVALEPRVVRLVPDTTGEYIALCSQRNLHVVKLVKHRGEFGEYFGWLKEPTFSPKPIAREFFHIHQYNLKLLQTVWHQSSLLLLTSDNTLRLFSLSDPETPLVMVPLLATPFASQPSSPSYTIEEPTTVVGFDVWKDSVFILQESGEVVLASLESGEFTAPLKMSPPSDDNYESESEATSLLVLSTAPCVLVIANSKGKLYHCVYLDDEDSSEFLFVAESIHLRRGSSDSPLTLLPDPLSSHQYFVLHGNGMHQVTLPSLASIQEFLTSDKSSVFVTDIKSYLQLDSSVKHLIATDESARWPGVAVVSELILGGTGIVGLLSTGVCCVVSAGRSRLDASFIPNVTDVEAWNSTKTVLYTSFSDFDQEIDEILHTNRTTTPVIRSFKDRSWSQQELYQYLTDSISRLKRESLQRQQTAKAAIVKKLKVLSEVRDTQFSEILRLQEEKEKAEERVEELELKLQRLLKRSENSVRRLETLACQIESHSPELSRAQTNMREELQQFERRVNRIAIPILQAKIKAEEFGPREQEVSHGLSEKLSKGLIDSLKHSTDILEKLTGEMKTLSSALPT